MLKVIGVKVVKYEKLSMVKALALDLILFKNRLDKNNSIVVLGLDFHQLNDIV